MFGDGEAVPTDLIGATIVRIGTVEGGEKFAIEYRPAGESGIKRAFMQFNERGMWLDSQLLHHHDSR
jgi:hypothetical protein